MARVLVINPPNSTSVLSCGTVTVTRPEDLTDWANVPSLGVLTLASALTEVPGVTPVYVDGTVVAWQSILDYIETHAGDLLAVCVSVLTASYEAGLALLRHAKQANPAIWTVIGNDHFTALPGICLDRQRGCVDFGFVGNEVVGPFRALIADLHAGGPRSPLRYAGLAVRTADGTKLTPQRPEPVPLTQRYDLIDAEFGHSGRYAANFRGRVGPRMRELLGVHLTSGVPMELARGCIKFSRDDACTFCSIQYGGMWRNSVPDAAAAWNLVESAVRHGYDYLSLTADELPLTFSGLLRSMLEEAPRWWRSLPERERPVFAGYARADGLSSPRHAAMLRALNVRYLMVGLDAGSPVSLAALNKPLAPVRDEDPHRRAELMYRHNVDALQAAREEGLLLKAGLVLGHLGMTPELLAQNVTSMCELIDSGKGAIASVDIEVLSPEPGSSDHRYLTEPDTAARAARRLGLEIAGEGERRAIAADHTGLDVVDREQAMRDYARALMPGVSLDDLAAARSRVREHCRTAGVVIGE